jgi:arsenate reductase
MEYWHNPRCSKSRQGKDLLDAAGSKYTERRYVDDPPTAKKLDRVLTALGKEPWDIARMGEDVAKELNLEALPHDRAKWIDVMVANPILIERPILITDDGRAALGRPPEALKDLL